MQQKIKLVFVLIGIVATYATKHGCDGIKLRGISHNEELLHGDNDIKHFNVDQRNDRIYFSYKYIFRHYLRPEVKEDKHAVLNPYSIPSSYSWDITRNGAGDIAIDQKNHEIYLVLSDGIYKYNSRTEDTELVLKIGNVYQIYFKDVLYFRVKRFGNLFTYSDGPAKVVAEFVDKTSPIMVIDDDGVMYFIGRMNREYTGRFMYYVYRQRKGTNEVVQYEGLGFPDALAIDNNNNVYVAVTEEGIYLLHKNSTTVEKVADIKNVTDLAFDSHNNLVYVAGKTLITKLTKC